MVPDQPWQLTSSPEQSMVAPGTDSEGNDMRDVLDYFPIVGSTLLTGGIAWLGYQWVRENRRKIISALRGRHYHNGGILVPNDETPAILDQPGEYRIYPGHPLYEHFRNSRRTFPNSRPVASGPAPTLPSEPAQPFTFDKVEGLPIEQRGRIDAGGNVTWKHGLSLSSGTATIWREELEKALAAGWHKANKPKPDAEFVLVSRESRPSEVTSEICDLCSCVGGHEKDCPRFILENICDTINSRLAPRCDARDDAAVSGPESQTRGGQAPARVIGDDEGEPLPIPPQPNMGGLGNPPYHGPHYDSVLAEEPRFVPYDVIGEVPEDRAVHIAEDGNGAVAGPLAVEHEGEKDAHSRREEDNS